MKVTSIRKQVKRSNRYSIFIDGVYAFSLSDSGLVESGLFVGKELTKSETKGFQKQALIDKQLSQVLLYAARRNHSRWEFLRYMQQKHFDEESIEAVLLKLSTLGFIDDYTFANMWVEGRRRTKPMSNYRLKQELYGKHIDSDIVDQILSSTDKENNEATSLRSVAMGKMRSTKYREDPRKLKQYLIRQGFPYDDVMSVVDQLLLDQ